SSRRRHTRSKRDWSSDVCSSDLGAPKVREVDVTVGGTRFLEIPESPGMAAARKVSPYGYLSDVEPGPIFVGVERPMKVYTIDNKIGRASCRERMNTAVCKIT